MSLHQLPLRDLYEKLRGPERSKHAYAKEKDIYGNLPFHRFMRSSTWALVDTIKLLLTLDPEGIKTRNFDGKLPIHVAALSGSTVKTCIEMLIQEYPEGLKVKCKDGNLPIHYAAQSGSVWSNRLLIQAYPESLQQENTKGQLPLHYAMLGARYDQTVDLLLNGFPDATKHQDSSGNLPIHLATMRPESRWRPLMQIYPEGLIVRNNKGQVPLHIAASYSPTHVIQQYCKVCLAAAKTPDDAGNLPIEIATSLGRLDHVATLARGCPESLEIVKCNHTGRCVCHENHPIIRLLSTLNIPKYRIQTVMELFKHCTSKQNSNSNKALEQKLKAVENKNNEVQDMLNKNEKEHEIAMEEQLQAFQGKLQEEKDHLSSSFETEIASLKARTDTLEQGLLESIKIESKLLSRLKDNGDEWSVEDLKSLAVSLNSRLDAMKPNYESSSRPSIAQRLLSYLLKEASPPKASLLQVIETLNSEVSSLLESTLMAPDQIATEAASVTRPLEGSPHNDASSRKRARVEASPE